MDSSASQSFDHSTVLFSILVGSSEIKFQFFLKRRASFFLRLRCSSVNKPNILQQCFYEIVKQGKVRRTVHQFISRKNGLAFLYKKALMPDDRKGPIVFQSLHNSIIASDSPRNLKK